MSTRFHSVSRILIATGLTVWVLGAGGLSAFGQAPAQNREARLRVGQSGRASIYSADRRFMVSGMTSAENQVLARQLTDLAAQVEEKTGMALPFHRSQILGVMVQSTSKPEARILKIQGWDGGKFYQRLIVPGGSRFDPEDLKDAACWLLLNRYVAEYTPRSQQNGMGATMPDWISSGLAQRTQAALIARNREWISRELEEGEGMPLATVIKQELLPPGRWREKAYASAAVEFLFPAGEFTTWAMLFKAVGTRKPIDAAWLRSHSPTLQNQNPERLWRAFLDQQSRGQAAGAWTDRGLQVEGKLLQTLNFNPRDLVSGVPSDVPSTLYARDLIAFRGQKWATLSAAALSLEVQSLMLGAPPTMQGVLASYAAYFNQIATPPEPKRSWWKRKKKIPAKLSPPDDATWQVALSQLWMRAERTHQAFLENHQSRKRYVDAFDRPSGTDFTDVPAESEGPRTRLQKAVDAFEEQQNPF